MPKKRTHDAHGHRYQPPQGDPLPLFSIVTCCRCAKACLLRQPTPPIDSPVLTLTPATTAHGLCEECAGHWWLYVVDGLRWTFEQGPGVLSYPLARTLLSGLLGRMHPALGQLDWDRLIAQWDLPWPADWTLPKDG